MQSILIVGGNLGKRKKKAGEIAKEQNCLPYRQAGEIANIDTLIIEGGNSIGIDEIRRFKQWVSRKPHSGEFKAAIIYKAEKLTHQAQNALLKTLEEPPKDTLIILTAPQESILLPTIISRCKIITLKPESEIKLDRQTSSKLLSVICYLLFAKIGERIQKAQEIAKTREEAIIFLDQLIFSLREILLQKHQITQRRAIVSLCDILNLSNLPGIPELAKILRKALKTKATIEKNVNTKLALENLFLDLPLLK